MNSPAGFVFPSDPNAMVPHGDASPTPRMDPSLSDPFHQAAEPIIGALFIDNLAKDMELDVVQRNHLQILNQVHTQFFHPSRRALMLCMLSAWLSRRRSYKG
jgi:hypothetical protein